MRNPELPSLSGGACTTTRGSGWRRAVALTVTDDAGPSEVADRNVIHGAPRWHEVQADRGIAAWLIPRPFFGGVALRTMHGQHTASKSVLRSPSKPLNP